MKTITKSPSILCFLALAAGINYIGGTLALLLRLPVYLDTIGTLLASILLGPFAGMVPGLLSGLISGFTSDIYALYYIPVQLITGFLAGIVSRLFHPQGLRLIPAAALISLPGTLVSSCITAFLFGGITSSGSTILVQLLHHAGFGMTASVCIVQAATDYLDRLIALVLAAAVLSAVPSSLKASLQKG
ncbi:MAG: ECF transporter S component [Lachnospiraceae bacterium]|nr:ECF transporter S component [Lachnospiraceae bacterium]